MSGYGLIENLHHFKKGMMSIWKNSDTTTIRIPKIFKNDILGYAHQLDNGVLQKNEDLKEKIISILDKVDKKEKGYKSNSCSSLIKELRKLTK